MKAILSFQLFLKFSQEKQNIFTYLKRTENKNVMQAESRVKLHERKEARNNHHIDLFMRKCMQYLHIQYEFNRHLFFSEFYFFSFSAFI